MKKTYCHPTISTIVINQCLPLAGSGPAKIKSSVNPAMKEAFFHSFFGVDLLQGTGGKWAFTGITNNNKGHAVYDFKVTNLNDPFFKEAEVHVFEGKGANYTFYSKVPEWNHPFDVVFMIEKNLIYGEGYTEDISIRRNREKINNKEWIEWEIDEINIKIWWDIDDDRKYSLNLWTPFALYKNIKHLVPKNQIVDDNYCSEIVSKEEFLSNFFGVDINNEPNNNWEYEGIFEGKNISYRFVRRDLKDKFFKACRVIAFEGGGCNFIWDEIPFDASIPYQIAYTIERNLFGNIDLTFDQCKNKYRDKYPSIDLKSDEFDIKISTSPYDEPNALGLTLWTHINKDDIIKHAKSKEPEKVSPDSPSKEPVISKEDFLSNFFGIDIKSAPDERWTYLGFTDGDRPHYTFSLQNLNDEFFNTCILLVLEDGGCLFSWGPAVIKNLEHLKVAAKIHRNLLGEKYYDVADSIREYLDLLLDKQNVINIEYEDYKIRITQENSDNTYGLTVWSPKNITDKIKKMIE